MRKQIRPFALALFAVALTVSSLQAGVITEGQWLQLNFTDGYYNAANDNFNYFGSASPDTNLTTGDSSTMIDSLGNSVDVTLSSSGFGGGGFVGETASWSGMGSTTPAPGSSTWSGDEIVNFWWANGTTPTLTLGGLDAGLAYNVYIYSKANAPNGEVTSVDVNGTGQDMAVRSARFLDGDEDLLFSNIAVVDSGDGTGDLAITLLDGPGSAQYNPILNSVIVEVIPEPATLGLICAMGGGLLFIRRRFMM